MFSPEDLDQLLPPSPLWLHEARYSWAQRLGNDTDHAHLCGAEQILIRRAITLFPITSLLYEVLRQINLFLRWQEGLRIMQ
jgi:hypothetical protein